MKFLKPSNFGVKPSPKTNPIKYVISIIIKKTIANILCSFFASSTSYLISLKMYIKEYICAKGSLYKRKGKLKNSKVGIINIFDEYNANAIYIIPKTKTAAFEYFSITFKILGMNII